MWEKIQNLNCQTKKKKCDKNLKLKLWQNSKTQIVTQLKNSNCDKTKKKQNVTKLNNIKLWQNSRKANWDGSYSDSSDSSSNSDIF